MKSIIAVGVLGLLGLGALILALMAHAQASKNKKDIATLRGAITKLQAIEGTDLKLNDDGQLQIPAAGLKVGSATLSADSAGKISVDGDFAVAGSASVDGGLSITHSVDVGDQLHVANLMTFGPPSQATTLAVDTSGNVTLTGGDLYVPADIRTSTVTTGAVKLNGTQIETDADGNVLVDGLTVKNEVKCSTVLLSEAPDNITMPTTLLTRASSDGSLQVGVGGSGGIVAEGKSNIGGVMFNGPDGGDGTVPHSIFLNGAVELYSNTDKTPTRASLRVVKGGTTSELNVEQVADNGQATGNASLTSWSNTAK